MNLNPTPGIETFRAEIRDWFASEFPKDIVEKTARGASLSTDDVRRSEMALGAKGWLASAWPEVHGGPGWSLEEQYVFDDELERAGAPTVTPMGVIYVGPVIYTFGTQAQKDRWLPGIRDGSVGWAQGYSEPGSGSDLASLQFSADREGDTYILNGTKVWTSAAQHADWIFLLARTSNSGRKQEGISFICCDLAASGVEVRPIITIDGKHVLNEVHFTDVRVPVDQLVGEEGKGWTYSQYLLGFERTSYARIGGKKEMLKKVHQIASETPTGGNLRLIDDDAFARRITLADFALQGLEIQVLRILSAIKSGGSPGNEASIVKIMATETHQQITELFLDAAGAYGQIGFDDAVTPDWAMAADISPHAAPSVSSYFGGRAQSIYGGTNEIQKNIIAKRVLGL
ncbi:MAG: acyl-CoA dehydrogenase family protein [Pseudomonadota bacterium]